MRIKVLLFRLPSLFPILYLALFHREGVLSLKKCKKKLQKIECLTYLYSVFNELQNLTKKIHILFIFLEILTTFSSLL